MTVLISFFTLAASCYLLYVFSDPLEKIGGRIGKLLRLPESVIASTFQALATSGPEIVMAILAATPVIASEAFNALQLAERASSGALNMSFSAMDNLLGIGALAIVFMLYKGSLQGNDRIPRRPSTIISLLFYVLISGLFSLFITNGVVTYVEAWVLMGIGITYVLAQFIIPNLLPDEEEDETDDFNPSALRPAKYVSSLLTNLFLYSFLVFALIVFVKLCLQSTFTLAMAGIASVGGVLIMFTSYVSSFPEFMLSYRYAIANKKSALLSMLFGSNVIDLAFSGFRPLWLKTSMEVYTTGPCPWLLPYYVWSLPILAIIILLGLSKQKIKWSYAKPALVFYVLYIISGFILL